MIDANFGRIQAPPQCCTEQPSQSACMHFRQCSRTGHLDSGIWRLAPPPHCSAALSLYCSYLFAWPASGARPSALPSYSGPG
jgi:hypothetical protein